MEHQAEMKVRLLPSFGRDRLMVGHCRIRHYPNSRGSGFKTHKVLVQLQYGGQCVYGATVDAVVSKTIAVIGLLVRFQLYAP